MNKIDLIDRDSGLEYSIDSIEVFCSNVLDELNIEGWELSLMFSDDKYIAELNRIYREKEGPTDVLSFCEFDAAQDWVGKHEGESVYAGDLIISVETLIKNSEYFGVSKEQELKRLIIHGILHLKGMDHVTNNPDEEMLVLQEKILSRFGEYKF
ncbi:MAG: rRNA maturation RNase YbeY [Spirochaetales bacterium]|uniref:Endoribonuclease YbeY n=1 Tax=Candidatus Thalassospirochaeta sargassi TaxID=3119039 RepID=A0AAJ1ID91_9SPIO|nr:rRNA maturation RNase YbeY [Spirochaetales bacterium]